MSAEQEQKFDFMELKRWCVLKGKQMQKRQEWRNVPEDGFGIQDAVKGIQNGETVEDLEQWHDRH